MKTTYKRRFDALSVAGLIIEKYRTNGSIELVCTVCGELYDRERGEGRAACVRDRTAISTHIANNHWLQYERAMERAEPASTVRHDSDGLSEAETLEENDPCHLHGEYGCMRCTSGADGWDDAIGRAADEMPEPEFYGEG